MLSIWVSLCCMLALVTSQTVNLRQKTCSTAGQYATIQSGAQAILGGILSLRDSGSNGYGCGNISPGSMQSYEAIRWALDRLNKKDTILNGEYLTDSYVPGVRLGMMVYDYCDTKSAAIGSAQELYPQFSSESRDCTKNNTQAMLGLVGASSSSVTKDLSEFSNTFNIPLVSFQATATELSNNQMYPYFMRTIPTDGPLMDAIIAMMNEIGWQYVVVVYTDNTFGVGSFDEVRKRLVNAGKCLTMAISTPADDISNTAMERILSKALSTKTVGVIYLGSRRVAHSLLQRAETYPNAGKLQWIFTDSLSLSEPFTNQKYPRGIISVLSGSRKIIEFEDHWVRIDVNNPSAENPWYKDWYQTTNNCKLPSNNNPAFNSFPVCSTLSEAERRSAFVQDQYVEPAVHAVFGYAYALKKAHQDKCSGTPGLCLALSTMTTEDFMENYLKNVEFTYTKVERVESLASVGLEPYNAAAKVKFDANGDIEGPTYDIYNFNDYPGGNPFKFRRLGSYLNGRMEIFSNRLRMYDEPRNNILSPLPTSPCPSTGCKPCLGLTADSPYMYKPGDFIINGIFSVHLKGMGFLQCGSFDKSKIRSGIKYLEAMFYAINQVNVNLRTTKSILNGVTLGGLGFDDCMSSSLGAHLVTEVQQHKRQIKDTSNNVLDPNSVESYIGAYGTELTIPLASLMDTIKRPLLGYLGTSTELSEYHYYRFLYPGNYYRIRAYVLMLKRLGWNYVQVIRSKHSYYEKFSLAFKKMAAEEGICVVSMFEVGTHGNMTEIFERLKGQVNVKPVALWASQTDINNFLMAVTTSNGLGNFHYIMYSSQLNPEALQGVRAAAEGILTIDVRHPDMTAFWNDLSNLRPNSYTLNPWFNEWYEEVFECSLDANNMRSYQTVCSDPSVNPITNKITPQEVSSVWPVVYGVYATAFGLHATLEHYCGPGYNRICGNFMNAADKGDILLKKIDEVSFNIDGIFNFGFKDGHAYFPIEYYNYRSGAFSKVGEYNFQTSQFSLNIGSIRLYGGALTTAVTPHCTQVCIECLYMFGNQNYMSIPGDIIIPAMFDIHYPGPLPYLCGDMKYRNGFQNSEAFKFALERINAGNSSVKLNNVKLGGLGFDGCMDNSRSSTIFAGIYNGIFPLDNGRFTIPVQKLTHWLTYSNEFTINMARLGLPIVTPAATSPVLDDKKVFQNFFRTIPSDGIRALAMAQSAKVLGFEYIITLNAPEKGARDALAKFKEYALAEGVCIGTSYEFVTDGTMDQLIQYIVSSSTRVVAVFGDPDQHIEKLLIAKSRNINAGNIIFMSNRVWSSPIITRTYLQYADKSLMFGMQPGSIAEFKAYMSKKFPLTYTDNPWFYEFYQAFFSCDLGEGWKYGVQCVNPEGRPITIVDFTDDVTVLPTIHAVTSIAEGVHRTLQHKCGQNYDGVCSKYLTDVDTSVTIREFMDDMNYTDIIGEMFKFIERETNRPMRVYRMAAFSAIQEGSFSGGNVRLVDTRAMVDFYKNIPAKCVGDCAVCYIKGDGAEKFTYFPADIMLVGLFDVHKQGPTPYTCGELNPKHGFQLVEAFHYAIEYVNSKAKGTIFENLLPGVTIGGIALDVCQSPTRAGNLVANIHSKNVELIRNGIALDPSRFDVYIGTMESESSIRVADVLNALGVPQISYGATSLKLQDRQKYRYFIRTVPADDKQARAIISFLKRFELFHVQVIHSFDSIGEFGREEFSRLAYLNRVCIAQNITVGRNGAVGETEARQALAQLYNKPDAKVVILFVADPKPFVDEIEKDTALRSQFKFIGTDKWGEDQDVWNGLNNIKQERGAVTFDVETADLPLLDQYLEYKTPSTYTFNPWFNEYYEYIYNCSLTGLDKNKANCPPRQYGIPRSPNYIQDRYVLYVVNAVFSAAIGAHKALQKLCPANFYGVCNLFRTSGERRQEILNGAKQAMFEDATRQPFYFTANGESDRGFHIWEPLPVSGTPGQYYLEDVGSYNDTDFLKIDARYDPRWNSPCEGVSSCQCPFPVYQPSRYMLNASTDQLNIVYLSDIHAADPYNPFACGAIDTQSNFQNLMAFFYALNLVNEYSVLPASLKLGGLALDTCSTPSRIGQDLYSLLSGEGICGEEGNGQVLDPSTIVVHLAKNSQNAIVTSNILSPLKGTTMSQSATSVELSDKNYHNYFLRTVPPDNIQALVMAQVIQQFGWDYISAVYTDNAYGQSAINTFLENTVATNKKTCTSIALSMKVDATLADARTIIDELNQRVGARVVVLFVTADHARLLLQATSDRGLNQRFVWLGSDTWANSMYVVKDLESTAVGALTIQIKSEVISNFTEFLKTFTFNKRHGLPTDWFEDIYQTLHQCRILNSVVKKTYTRICSGTERITDDMIPQDPYVLHTIISVFMVAQGLNKIEVCKASALDLYPCLSLQKDRLDLIYKGIKEAQYTVLPNYLFDKSFIFKFNDDGYGDIGYNVLNFRRDNTNGQYQYVKIGTYQQELVLDRSKYQQSSFVDSRTIPSSECPIGGRCFCKFANGTTYSYSRAGTPGVSYYVLEDGSYVNAQTGQIMQVESSPETEDRFRDIWGIIVATLAGIGVFASLCVFIYLLVVYPVRSGTTVLGYMLAFGIVLLYAMVFAFIVHATEEVCGLRRFCLGLVYAICYSSLFVKLVDCWRNKEKEDVYGMVKYTKLGKPLGLFFVACLLVLVQCMINAEWLILETPSSDRVLYNKMLWPRCMPDDFYDEGLMLSLVYIMVIICISLIIGLFAWPSVKNHRESRWIVGIFALSVPVWVVFGVVSTLGAYKMRDAAVAIGLLVNATIMFLLGPLRKLYLLNKFEAKMEEEERKSALDHASQRDSSMYGRQYDNLGQLHETNSMRGSMNVQEQMFYSDQKLPYH